MARDADTDDQQIHLYLEEESRKLLTELTGNALGMFRVRAPRRFGTLIASADVEWELSARRDVMSADLSSFWYERFLSPRSEQMHHSYYHLLEALNDSAEVLL
jgi:hypothetical protein